MTRDEILKLEAGRELDALVAEKVMGLSLEHLPTVYEKGNTEDGQDGWSGFVCPKCRRSQDMLDEPCAKAYSTNIAAAWEVFKFLSANSIETVVRKENVESVSIGYDSEGWSCSIWWFKDIQSAHAVEGIYAETPELAICRAALLALMT